MTEPDLLFLFDDLRGLLSKLHSDLVMRQSRDALVKIDDLEMRVKILKEAIKLKVAENVLTSQQDPNRYPENQTFKAKILP